MSMLRNYREDEEAIAVLLGWLKQARLLLLQSQGEAMSEPQIRHVEQLFPQVMQAITWLTESADSEDEQGVGWLLQQVSEFYCWLNGQCGLDDAQRYENWLMWQPSSYCDSTLSAEPKSQLCNQELPPQCSGKSIIEEPTEQQNKTGLDYWN